MVNQKNILFTTLLMLTLATVQGAGDNAHAPQSVQRGAQYHSLSGDAVFPIFAERVCAGDIIPYTTKYQGTTYSGVLQVRSPSGIDCEDGGGK